MPKVSVIIPVYNVEKYLRECLDSLINQTLKDIEIICVNDGSTDNCPQILDEYAKKDSRITVIHKENGGYGSAMNIGLETAKGEYVGIVESDDFVELNMFETLYNEAKNSDLEVVRSDFYLYNSKLNTNEILYQNYVEHNEIYAPKDKQIVFHQPPAIWANLYNREFLNKNKIRFLETPGASYQDTAFSFKVYACANRFKMIDKAFLHYRIDNDNSSVNSLNKLYCVCDEYKEIEKFIKETNRYEDYRYLVPKIKYGCYSWNYNRLSKHLKFRFLKKMSFEFFMHFMKREIDYKFFKRKLLKILIIAFVPYLFLWRKTI